MTLQELLNNIAAQNIPDSRYSIDEGLKPEALNLYKNYSKWEFFYYERGERNGFKVFFNEEEAYQYLWDALKRN